MIFNKTLINFFCYVKIIKSLIGVGVNPNQYFKKVQI